LVTGSGSGIGKALCEALLERGAKVACVDIPQSKASALCRNWSTQYGADRVLYVSCDVTDSVSFEHAFHRTRQHFAPTRIGVVVNNAGIGEIPLLQHNQNWRKVVDIDLTAVIDGTRLAALEMMQQQGGDHTGSTSATERGVIVNVASMAGLLPQGITPVYTAAKFGVLGFSRAMGEHLSSHGIRVNAICPSYTDTPLLRQSVDIEKAKTSPMVQSVGLVPMPLLISGFLRLIEDSSVNGMVMRVTARNGVDFQQYVGTNAVSGGGSSRSKQTAALGQARL